MVFTHDTEVSLQAAVALVNTAEDPDTMQTLEELDAFYARFEYTGRRDRDAAGLASIRGLRPTLRKLLTADRDAAAGQVNVMLAEASALPRLVRHDRWDWHLHAVDPDSPFVTRVIVETAMAMVDVIRVDELSRLAVCAQDDCGGLVLDLSRNRSRRYCSTTCTNRAAVTAYRERRRRP